MNKKGEEFPYLVIGKYLIAVVAVSVLFSFVYSRASDEGIRLQADAYEIAFTLSEFGDTYSDVEVTYFKRDIFLNGDLDLDFNKGIVKLKAVTEDKKPIKAESEFLTRPGVSIGCFEFEDRFVLKKIDGQKFPSECVEGENLG